VTVGEGETVISLAARLEKTGAVRNRHFFRALVKFQGTDKQIKRGIYRIEPGMSSLQIHDLLVEWKQQLHRVTIPEGYTTRGVAKVLSGAGIVDEDQFIQAVRSYDRVDGISIQSGAEGLLFPDTYLFQQDFSAERVVDHLVNAFFKALEKVEPDYRSLSPRRLYDTLIIASIVEREYRREEEAPLMASVFWNRLEIGMPLQSCATVVYVLTEEKGRPHPERITFRDLEVDSIYNTYIRPGLPPAPISNPGLTALKAAFHPRESDYLFFILTNPETGEHLFTRNYSDHDRAYQLYIKGR
jgi:UPF0755 protein